MTMVQKVSESKVDVLLGKAALERGLITPDQLRGALAEQAAGVARGRKRPRRLGVILVEKHYITDRQLMPLLKELESRILSDNIGLQRDKLVGFILIEQGMAQRHHVLECLRIQGEAVEEVESRVPRLSELLVQKGYATAESVQKAQLLQNWTILVCRTCLRQTTVMEFRPGAIYQCPGCKGILDSHGPADTLMAAPAVPPPLREDEPEPEPEPEPASPPPPPESEIPTVLRRTIRPPVAIEREPDEEPPREEAPPLGSFGKYTLLREIGRGAMGVVYEALDTGLNRKVALKLMISESYQDPAEAAIDEGRFIREAQLIAKLPKHSNIVTIYAAGIQEGKRYIAMEYVDGVPLCDWRKRGSVSIRQQVRVLRDVALAVHHAHQYGVIHRDLKPLNILVDSRNQACVTDFGLARRLDRDMSTSLTSSVEVVGTPAYMSPEQARGSRKVDNRTDIYSLGAMLYEIMTGRPPFQGSTPMDILLKVVNEPVIPPSRRARGIAALPGVRDLEGACLKALSKRPLERHSTARAFADELTNWLTGRGLRPSSPFGRARRK